MDKKIRLKQQGSLTLILEIGIILALFITVHLAGIKYLIAAFPAVYLIAASGLQSLEWFHLRLIIGAVLVFFIGMNTISFFHQTSLLHSKGFPDLINNQSLGTFIKANIEADDVLLIDTYHPGLLLGLSYYLRPEQRVWCGNPKDVAEKIHEKTAASLPERILYMHSTHRPGDDASRDNILLALSERYRIGPLPSDDEWHLFYLQEKPSIPSNFRE